MAWCQTDWDRREKRHLCYNIIIRGAENNPVSTIEHTSTQPSRKQAHHRYLVLKLDRDAREMRKPLHWPSFWIQKIPKSLSKKNFKNQSCWKKAKVSQINGILWGGWIWHIVRGRRESEREKAAYCNPLFPYSVASRRSPAAAAKHSARDTGYQTLPLFPFTQKKRFISVRAKRNHFLKIQK